MNRLISVAFSVLGLLMLLTLAASASSPRLINYQGRLADGTGNPENGSFSLTFSIYGDESSTSALWSEVQSVTVTDGFFDVLLGSVTPIPSDLFDDSTRWLGVQVGSDPELPKVRLVTTPYSFRSEASDSAGTVSDNVVTGGKIQDGSIEFSDIGNNGAASGQIMKWNGTAWVPASDETSTGGSGDIDGVVAGTGLTGGGTSGTVTLSIADGGVGATQVADNSLTEPKLSITNSGVDGQVLTKNGSQFTWVNDQTGTGSDGDWTISGNDITSAVSGKVNIGSSAFAYSGKLNVDAVSVPGTGIIATASGANNSAIIGSADNVANAAFFSNGNVVTRNGDMITGPLGSALKYTEASSAASGGTFTTFGPSGNRNIRLSSLGSNADYGYISVYDALGTNHAAVEVLETGEGVVATWGSSGNLNVALSSLSGYSDHGYVAVRDASGDKGVSMFVDNAGDGHINVYDHSTTAVGTEITTDNGTGTVTVYGNNGSQNVRLGYDYTESNANWGEVSVMNETGANRVTAYVDDNADGHIDIISNGGNLATAVTTEDNSGWIWLNGSNGERNIDIWHAGSDNHGEIDLCDDGGTAQAGIYVRGDNDHGVFYGDDIQLYSEAIDAYEVSDEPGLARNVNTAGVSLSASLMQDIVTVTINAPSAGYIHVLGKCYLRISGTLDQNGAIFQIDTAAAGSVSSGRYVEMELDTTFTTQAQRFPIFVDHVFQVSTAGSYTFRLEGYKVGTAGDAYVYQSSIVATYFPTSYGSVAAMAENPGDNPDVELVESVVGDNEQDLRTEYKVDLRYYELRLKEARLQAAQAELELIRARSVSKTKNAVPDASSAQQPKAPVIAEPTEPTTTNE